MPQFTDSAPLVASIDSTAELLGISRSTVYKLMSDGTLRYVQLGGRRMIPRAAIEELLAPSA